jgi:hypothetical protein
MTSPDLEMVAEGWAKGLQFAAGNLCKETRQTHPL